MGSIWHTNWKCGPLFYCSVWVCLHTYLIDLWSSTRLACWWVCLWVYAAFTVGARPSVIRQTSLHAGCSHNISRHPSKSTQRQFEIQIIFHFLHIVLCSINGLLPIWFEVSRQRQASTNIFPFQKFKCNKNVIQVWLNHRTRMHCFVVVSTLTPHPVRFLLEFSLSLNPHSRLIELCEMFSCRMVWRGRNASNQQSMRWVRCMPDASQIPAIHYAYVLVWGSGTDTHSNWVLLPIRVHMVSNKECEMRTLW